MPTTIDTTMIEDFLGQYAGMRFSVAKERSNSFIASVYWPSGDVLLDKFCCGHGATLSKAIADMDGKIEKAKLEGKKLTTAAECKAAVLDLIREHDAAPASFRDAVDALPVKG